ncbi:MAG: nucleotide exchange factor GrpE [Lactobacillus sp.]|jgi:molecular chaperone GrpE|nr:nucleotide exchange factor GrpE [Lactobacillus sp.]
MTQADKKQEKKPAGTKEEAAKAKKEQPAKAAKQDQSKQAAQASEAKIAELTKAADDWQDKFLRSQAELQNAQKRYNKERAQLIKYESQNLAKDVLPAVDNLERALAVKADDDASKQLKKGVQMTLDLLVKSLQEHGIKEIKADGEKFDPTLHQAVQTVAAENDDQKDQIVQVLQKGYQYKDRTLRPAMVVVAQ